jgi:hypothetical protein
MTVVTSCLVADDAPVLVHELDPGTLVDRRHSNTGTSKVGEQDRGQEALRRF